MAAAEPTPVPAVGARLANIPITAADGHVGRLTTETQGSRAVVFFLRSSTCAVCLGHARTLIAMKGAGELGDAELLAIVPGDAAEVDVARKRLTSDAVSVWASGSGHAAVGLGKFLMVQHSGTFVLDTDGSILAARTATIPTGSFSKDEVKAALAS